MNPHAISARPQEPLRIDIDALLRARLPRHSRFVPGFAVDLLKRIVCQDVMNEALLSLQGLEGADFCRGVMEYLHVTCGIAPGSRLPSPENRRLLFVCNHPLGGLDGVALIDIVTRWAGGIEPYFPVNDLLMALAPLHRIFVPINKHGRQCREEMGQMAEAFAGDQPIIIFPAGLVSRRGDDGTIADLEWKKMFVTYARRYRRDIVPLYFDGQNSPSFYKWARRRVKLGLKFNIEMILLPREMLAAAGKHFTLYAGTPIPWQQLTGGDPAHAKRIRNIVYNLKNGTDN